MVKKNIEDVREKLQNMSLDHRANLITPIDFSLKSELFDFIKTHCYRVLQYYRITCLDEIKLYKISE